MARELHEYKMIICGEKYNALFLNKDEAMDFVADNVFNGDAVVILEVNRYTRPREVIKLKGYESAYLIEMVGEMMGIAHGRNIAQIENTLRIMGVYR